MLYNVAVCDDDEKDRQKDAYSKYMVMRYRK